jgi:hypothetical protein
MFWVISGEFREPGWCKCPGSPESSRQGVCVLAVVGTRNVASIAGALQADPAAGAPPNGLRRPLRGPAMQAPDWLYPLS